MAVDLTEFRSVELAVSELISQMSNEGASVSEATLNAYAAIVGKYSRAINNQLNSYAKISYDAEKESKITFKAYIKFAYDFLALLMAILKQLDLNPAISDYVNHQFQVLENLIDNKEGLIESEYKDAAKIELEAFYSVEIRNKLDAELAKRLK
jgi:hypothetical protein